MTATTLTGWVVRLRNPEGHVERLEHFRANEREHAASWARVLEWRFLYPLCTVEREAEYETQE